MFKTQLIALAFMQGYGTAVSIAGIRGTGDYGADERPKDFREYILWETPNGEAPLTALMSKMKTEGLTDPEFYWFEEEEEQIRVKVNGALTNVATTAAVHPGSVLDSTGGRSMVAGDLYIIEDTYGRVNTNEIIQVTGVTSDTAVTIARGQRGSVAAAIPDGAHLLKIGTIFGEGTLSPGSATKNPTKFENYAQIFKTSYSVTNTDIKTKKRTGDVLANERKRAMFKHATALEYAYLMGQKHLDTDPVNGKPRRSTNGLLRQITTNKVHFGTGGVAWNEDNFIDSFAPCFDVAGPGIGDDRIVLCGNGALTEMNKLIKNGTNSRFNFEGVLTSYGMKLQSFVIPQGRLLFKTHPLFNKHPKLRYAMVGLNAAGLIDRALRKTTFEDNIQPNNADYKEGQWITESGPEVHFEKSHFFLTNVGAKIA